jgi:lambda family phage portal protein
LRLPAPADAVAVLMATDTKPRLIDEFGKPLAVPRRRDQAVGGTSWQAYDAGGWNTPETKDWNTWLASPDVEINFLRDTIVARVRDLVRNDGWASGAVTRILDSVVGADFRLVAKPDWRALEVHDKAFDRVWADEFGRAAEARWRNWAYDPGRYCDSGRRYTVPQLFRLAFRGELVDGESLMVVNWLPQRRGPGRARYATSLLVVDPDRLSNPQMAIDTHFRRGGVEIDEFGAAVAYHIRRAHQGDWFSAADTVIWDQIERETEFGRPVVLHAFDSDRPAQHRGSGGIFAPILGRMKMLARYDAVELQAAVVNAIFAAYIESPYDDEQVRDALDGGDGVSQYQMLRGQYHKERGIKLDQVVIPRLFPGEKITSVDAKRPASNYASFEGAVLRNAATAIGVSAEQLSQDWSKTNYSSARGALLEAWKTLSRRQKNFAAATASPVYGAFLEESMDRNELPLPAGAPDFIEERAAYSACLWMGPPRGWIDPVKEAQAAVLRMDAGLSTLEQECAEQGLDWEDQLAQRAIERARFKELGLPYPDWFGQPAADAGQKPDKPLPQ